MGYYFVQVLSKLELQMTFHEKTWKLAPGVRLKTLTWHHRPDANTGILAKRKNLPQFKAHENSNLLSSNSLTLHLQIPLTGHFFDT